MNGSRIRRSPAVLVSGHSECSLPWDRRDGTSSFAYDGITEGEDRVPPDLVRVLFFDVYHGTLDYQQAAEAFWQAALRR